jgi:hypothetical protein
MYPVISAEYLSGRISLSIIHSVSLVSIRFVVFSFRSSCVYSVCCFLLGVVGLERGSRLLFIMFNSRDNSPPLVEFHEELSELRPAINIILEPTVPVIGLRRA